METNQIHPLRIFCLRNKITQYALAKKLNISPVYLGLILNFKCIPSKSLAKKIANMTDIPILSIFYPEEFYIKSKRKLITKTKEA